MGPMVILFRDLSPERPSTPSKKSVRNDTLHNYKVKGNLCSVSVKPGGNSHLIRSVHVCVGPHFEEVTTISKATFKLMNSSFLVETRVESFSGYQFISVLVNRRFNDHSWLFIEALDLKYSLDKNMIESISSNNALSCYNYKDTL